MGISTRIAFSWAINHFVGFLHGKLQSLSGGGELMGEFNKMDMMEN